MISKIQSPGCMLDVVLKITRKCIFLIAGLILLSCVPLYLIGPDSPDDDPTEYTGDDYNYVNDSFEPNDIRSKATAIKEGKLSNLIGIPYESDYFRFITDTASIVTFSIRTTASSEYQLSSTKLTLYKSSDFTACGYQTTAEDSLYISFYSTRPDTLYFQIYFNSSPSMTYSINLHTLALDENDVTRPNNSQAQATTLDPGRFTGAILSQNDTDWFKFSVKKGDFIALNINSPDPVTSLFMPMHQFPANAPRTSSQTTYTYKPGSDDTCYLRIVQSAIKPGFYELILQSESISEDVYEENDSKILAPSISSTNIDSLHAINLDYDWYKMGFDSLTCFKINLKTSAPTTGLTLSLESLTQPIITLTSVNQDSMSIEYTALPHDTFFIKILNTTTVPSLRVDIPYSLIIDTINLTSKDPLEPNNTKATGIYLEDSLHSVIIASNDYDWYKLCFDSTTRFVITLSESSTSSDVFCSLESRSGIVQTASTKSYDSLRLTYIAYPKDTFYLYIKTDSTSIISKDPIPYILNIKKEVLTSLDPIEPNNSKVNGTLIEKKRISSFILDSHDTDWYKIPIDKDCYMTVTVTDTFDHRNNIQSEIFTSAYSVYDVAQVLDTAIYNYYSKYSDTVYIRVSNHSIIWPVHYSISIRKETIIDDTLGEDDSKPLAQLLEAGQTDTLFSFQNDGDWYKFGFDSTTCFEVVLTTPTKPVVSSILLESENRQIKDIPFHLADSSKISFIAFPHDTFYVNIMNGSTNRNNQIFFPYLLTIRTLSVSNIDSLEPNNTMQTANNITDNVQSALVGQNDTDWFEIPLEINDFISLKVAPVAGNTNGFYTWISTLGGEPVFYQYPDSLVFKYYSASNIPCYQAVCNRKGDVNVTPTKYNITITKSRISDDKFENNDSIISAKLITEGKIDSLISVYSNKDWYKIVFDEQKYIKIIARSTQPLTNNGSLSMMLRTRNEIDPIKSENSNTDSVNISYICNAGDTMYLNVSSSYSSVSNYSYVPYELYVESYSLTEIDDSLEQNDSPQSAREIQSGIYKLNLFDEDWYSINLDSGDTLNLNTLAMSYPLTDVTVSIYQYNELIDLHMLLLQGNIYFQQTSSIKYEAATAGNYLIAVQSKDGGILKDYVLSVTIGK